MLRRLAPLAASAIVLIGCSGGIAADEGSVDQAENPAGGGEASQETAESGSAVGDSGESTSSTTTETTVQEQDSGDAAGAVDGADCRPEGGPVWSLTVEAAGVEYPVRIYRSPAVEGAAPLVLDWHGLGSDGLQQALLSGYESLAEDEGFMVVHPTGREAGDSALGRWEIDRFDDPTRDDLVFFDVLVERLVQDFCADANRIYSTGMSNGGFFTSRLICERADRIAAAVSVAGGSHPDDCDPARPVPYLAFHGTADRVVPFDGGRSSLELPGGGGGNVVFDEAMLDEFSEFASDFGCDPAPTEEALTDEVIRYDFQSCDDGIEMAFVEVTGGGHTWPGSPIGGFIAEFLGKTTDDIDATDDGWRFLSRYTLDGRGE